MKASPAETGELVATDGIRLRYSHWRGNHRVVVVVVPGIFVHRENREHRLLAARLLQVADVVVLDVRGHGDSEGAFSWGRQEPEDVAELARSLRAQYARVGGLGFSYGGYHAGVAAARHHVFDALALVAAPASLFIFDHNFLSRGLLRSAPAMIQRQRRRTRLALPGMGRRPTLSGLVDQISPAPLLIVHGADDWLVPAQHGRLLYQRAAEPKSHLEIEGGLHAEYLLATDPEPLLEPLVAFFDRWLRRVRRDHPP